MSKSTDHYYMNQLAADLRKIGREGDAEILDIAQTKVEEAVAIRNNAAKAMFEFRKSELFHVLRKCHQRRIDTLTVYTPFSI